MVVGSNGVWDHHLRSTDRQTLKVEASRADLSRGRIVFHAEGSGRLLGSLAPWLLGSLALAPGPLVLAPWWDSVRAQRVVGQWH